MARGSGAVKSGRRAAVGQGARPLAPRRPGRRVLEERAMPSDAAQRTVGNKSVGAGAGDGAPRDGMGRRAHRAAAFKGRVPRCRAGCRHLAGVRVLPAPRCHRGAHPLLWVASGDAGGERRRGATPSVHTDLILPRHTGASGARGHHLRHGAAFRRRRPPEPWSGAVYFIQHSAMLRSSARVVSRAGVRGSVAYQQHGRQRLAQQQLMPAAATSLEQRRGFLPGPLVRLIAQVAVSAAGVFSKAFMQAYQEAAAGA